MIGIGVTGHRPHRLQVPERALARRVRSVLGTLAAAARGGGIEVVSPLAEGTDQIVACAALELGLPIAALLPFPRKDYEGTFDDRAATRRFRQLLASSHRRLCLGGTPRRSKAAYVAVGDVTLAQCDIVLTIWDGKPAQGRGGTPEILQNALEWDIPIVWIDAVEDRTPRIITRKARNKSVPDLMGSARRAADADRARLRDLVRRIQDQQT